MDELIGTQEVPVIAGTTVLTEENYLTLDKILSSNDEADHKMAQLILNQCNVQLSIYWIWKLAKYKSNRMVNLRTKASRKFRDDSNLFYISHKNEYEFSKWLDNKNWLTPDLFQLLKPGVVRILSHDNTNRFYDLHFTVREDKKHFDPEQELEALPRHKHGD